MPARAKLLAILSCLLFTILPATPIALAAEDFDSLAAQIESANAAGAATITLTADITLTKTLPALNAAIVIKGNGHTINGRGEIRIFDIVGGSLSIQSLALTGGFAERNGGAILLQNNARLTLDNVSFDNNHAKWGGAIAPVGFSGSVDISNSVFFNNSAGSSGGAILWNGGALNVVNSVFMENRSDSWGGAIDTLRGTASISNSTLFGNTAGEAGGILVSGATTTMTHLTLVDNHARWGAGNALHERGGEAILRNSLVTDSGTGRDCAGAVDLRGNISGDGSCALLPAGDLRLGDLTGSPGYFPLQDGSPAIDAADDEFCLATDQIGTARPQGAGCDAGSIEAIDAMPPEATPIPTICELPEQILAANTNRAVGACPAGTSRDIITLSEDIKLDEPLPHINSAITIEGNGHSIDGAARFPIFVIDGRKLTINNLRLINGRVEGSGGAILARNDSELVVNNAVFKFNQASSYAMGDRRYAGGFGGAISTQSFSGNITVNNSVFEGNSSEFFGGAIYINSGSLEVRGSAFINNRGGGFGGAINVRGGRTTIENSTFRWNNAGYGGAIAVNGGEAVMTHLTMLQNRSSSKEGDAVYQDIGTAALRNSITYDGGSAALECHGNVSASGNFSEDGSCGGEEAGYPHLGSKSGDPAYFPPLEGSPVVDAADPAFCLLTDQLGNVRPAGAGCDIGAIEFGASPAPQAAEAADAVASGCMATTTVGLNFRDGPGGQRIGGVPAGESLVVISRTDDWLQVRRHGVTGWISAGWTKMIGDCG